MSNRAQMILRNAAFLGPAGANGLQGVQGPSGITIYDAQAAAAALTNITADTNFGISKDVGSGAPTAGKILRVTAFGRWTIGAAQSLTIKAKVGATVIATPAIAIGAAGSGSWEAETIIYFTAVGAGGSMQIKSKLWFFANGSSAGSGFVSSLGATAIDTTAAQLVRHSFVSTVANNTLNEDAQIIEALN